MHGRPKAIITGFGRKPPRLVFCDCRRRTSPKAGQSEVSEPKPSYYRARNRKFEFIPPQRGVRCEPTLGGAPIFAGSRCCVFEVTATDKLDFKRRQRFTQEVLPTTQIVCDGFMRGNWNLCPLKYRCGRERFLLARSPAGLARRRKHRSRKKAVSKSLRSSMSLKEFDCAEFDNAGILDPHVVSVCGREHSTPSPAARSEDGQSRRTIIEPQLRPIVTKRRAATGIGVWDTVGVLGIQGTKGRCRASSTRFGCMNWVSSNPARRRLSATE